MAWDLRSLLAALTVAMYFEEEQLGSASLCNRNQKEHDSKQERFEKVLNLSLAKLPRVRLPFYDDKIPRLPDAR